MTQATELNIRRKSAYADHVQLRNGIPLPSWIDMNVTELCNRQCVFCPRIDPNVYPNQNLFMSLDLVEKIGGELRALNYEGAVVLSGFGESLLHPQILHLAQALGPPLHTELVTNGDRLTVGLIKQLFQVGLSFIAVSVYDGQEQLDRLGAMFALAGCGEDQSLLRDRWHGPDQGFGLKLTNRAGTVDAGNQPPVLKDKLCFYPAYSMMIDFNGDVLLCVQDWNKKVRFGNLNHQRFLEVWMNKDLSDRRARLALSGRHCEPCNKCNATGTVHGGAHAGAWGYY